MRLRIYLMKELLGLLRTSISYWFTVMDFHVSAVDRFIMLISWEFREFEKGSKYSIRAIVLFGGSPH